MRTPTLYDFAGNPIKKSSLTKEQGAPEISGVRTYGELMPAGTPSPARLAAILKAASAGDIFAQAQLFDDMEERDVHIFSEMSTRRRAITGLKYEILPADDSKQALKIAEFVSAVLHSLQDRQNDIAECTSVPALVFALSDAIGKGLSCTEIIWDISGGQYVPASIVHRPLQFFQFHPKRPSELRLRDGSYEGEELISGKWMIHFHPSRSGSPYRAPLYRVLAWLFVFRNYTLRAWVQFIESFGIPIRIGRYPLGSSEADQKLLLQAVSNIAADAAVILPEGMDVDIINVARSAAGNPQMAFQEWSEKQISKAILGTYMTGETGGSYAKAQVLNEVRLDILESDASLIEATINNQLIRPIVQLNFGPDAPVPYLQFEIPRPDEREKDVKVLETLVKSGFTDIPLWWIRERFGIPAPEQGDVTLRDLLAGSLPQPGRQLQRKQTNRSDDKIQAQQAEIDALIKRLGEAEEIGEAMRTLLEPVMQLINDADSFDELGERIATAYPEMNGAEIERILQKAIFLSELWGRINGDTA
ncbi:DUF935 domain-containing protein [Thermodesulforhabdus norvegica]|uniref:Mu-like prophage protein gp29 n=1 Tax=Thermodesulforhabdus norvegica TaxID=39841 RepID=A0A1I4SU43_9BACT|nr:DUF935 domain-containing protein [Thermodesulforhabdus norvegica]SFM68058.1 Mu-like prophage protein gp29 [Thermodesulforhabdus norvegica]